MPAEQVNQPIVDTKSNRIAHIGVVVRDAAKTARQYARLFGIGPWVFFDSVPTETNLHGKPIRDGESCVRLGLAQMGNLEIELLQPVYGPSAHMEFLQNYGEGIHHLSFSDVREHARFVSALENSGFEIEMEGISSDVIPFTYMATREALGTIYEVPSVVPPEKLGKVAPWGTYEHTEYGLISMADKKIAQVGIVVSDAEKVAKNYWKIFGIGPWTLIDFMHPTTSCDYFHGIPAAEGFDFKVKAAIAEFNGLEIELLEPVYGPSTHMDFLKTHGQGVHHISFHIVDDHDEIVEAMAKEGIDIEMAGVIGGSSRYTYLSTQDSLCTILECLKVDPNSSGTVMPYGTYPPS